MRVKKIGAILAGAVMIGSAVAAAWSPAENKDFFVDPETGEPNAIVVVGANAAASDVTAAGWIAAQIGNMAYYEETTTEKETYTFDSNDYASPYDDDWGDNPDTGDDTGSDNVDAILIANTTNANWTQPPYYPLESLWWDDKNEDGIVDTDESREEVFVDFTMDPVRKIYPLVDLYDYRYRTVVEDLPVGTYWFGGEDNLTPYWLVTDPVTVKFLGYFYDIIDYGTDPDYGDYVVYGTPHWSETECRGDDMLYFEVGETKDFYGWEITLKDVDIYEFKAKWLIKGPDDEEPCEYFVVLSPYDPDVDPVLYDYAWNEVNATIQGREPTNQEVYKWLTDHAGESIQIDDHWYDVPAKRCFTPLSKQGPCEYDVIGIEDKICDLPYTVFALDTVKLFVGAGGVNEAAARLYALTDYGIIHDAVCVKPCGPDSYQWDLDVEFNKDIEYYDDNGYYIWGAKTWEDNDGDGADGNEPAGGDLSPAQFDTDVEPIILNMKLHSTLDVRICGSQINVPLCEWKFPMCGIDDFDVNVADAPIYLTLSVDDSDDWDHTDYKITNGFTVTQEVVTGTTTTVHKVDIDPMSLVVNDDEVTETMKATSNLILVGGPGLVVCVGAEPQVANTLTQELVDQGLSTVDWSTSTGEYEYIANAFAEGKDVIIVAGADREATKHAVEMLINDLKA